MKKSFLGVRKDFFIGINLQLHAMAVLNPFALKVNFDFVGIRKVVSYGGKLAPVSFVEGVACRCRDTGIFCMVKEDTITVVFVLKYWFYKSAFHSFVLSVFLNYAAVLFFMANRLLSEVLT